jgi:putative membrane protein insertion efficiency factor
MTPVRRVTWIVGAPARGLLLGMIRVYRATFSGWLGGQCRFYPTCSHYAEDAIRIHGAAKGGLLATWRVLRCNPYGTGGIDHVRARAEKAGPPVASKTASYGGHAGVSDRVHA